MSQASSRVIRKLVTALMDLVERHASQVFDEFDEIFDHDALHLPAFFRGGDKLVDATEVVGRRTTRHDSAGEVHAPQNRLVDFGKFFR